MSPAVASDAPRDAMSSLLLCIWLMLSQVHVYASENEYEESPSTCERLTTFQYLNNTGTVTFETCPGNCVVKCCPHKHMLLIEQITEEDPDLISTNSTCVDNEEIKRKFKNIPELIDPSDYSKAEIDIYSKKDFNENNPVKTGRKLSDFIFIFSEKFLGQSPDCNLNLIEYFPPTEYAYYFLEDGSLRMYSPNEAQLWTDYPNNEICVDYQITTNLDGDVISSVPKVNFRAMSVSIDTSTNDSVRVYAMMISCFFLTLTLCVYATLRKLRNLQGKVLMAVVTSFLATFLCKIVMEFATQVKTENYSCQILSVIQIYAILSLFAWMNVLSYSVMRTFTLATRHVLTARQENGRLRRYILFAFGLPLIYIAFIVVVDHLDLTHLPWFIKPHIFNSTNTECFPGYHERRLYLNIPITIAIATNTCMFGVTVIAYVKQKRSINKNMPSSATKSQQDKNSSILLVLKLSVMMGIMWVFEVISTEVDPGSPGWMVCDVYNALSGLVIFILFVCTKKVLGMLSKKYPIFVPLARKCGVAGFSDETSRMDTETTVSNWHSRSSTRNAPARPSVEEQGDEPRAASDARHSRQPQSSGNGEVCTDIYFTDYKKEPLPVRFVPPP